MSEPSASATQAGARKRVAAWRLTAVLAGAGALSGLLVAAVYQWTLPTIEADKAHAIQSAVREVLKEPARIQTLYLVGGRLVTDVPPGADADAVARVYAGYRADGGRAGYAVVAEGPGFQDTIRLMFGYDPATRTLLGMKILESKETPGIGDNLQRNAGFLAEFRGAAPPLRGVKRGGGAGDPHAVDMITGATISSRAVIRIINTALDRVGPALAASSNGATQ